MTIEEVILVNENDEPIGTMEKLQAHREGRLHRAFSVFIFNPNGDLLLQKRAAGKYHSAGLWSNTCCSHPRPGESVEGAALRRLVEEMGISTSLVHLFSFIYHAPLDELTEHEVDHILIGFTGEEPQLNQQEVSEWKYMDIADVEEDMLLNPLAYTVWFRKCFHQVMSRLDELMQSHEKN